MPTIKSHKNRAVIITRNVKIVVFHHRQAHRRHKIDGWRNMFTCPERGIFQVPKRIQLKMNLWKSNFTKWRKWCRFIDFLVLFLLENQPKNFKMGAGTNLYLYHRIYWQCCSLYFFVVVVVVSRALKRK